MTETTIRSGAWNTYTITGYTHQVGGDRRATGGVHLHQVRRTKSGWQRRTMDNNGRYAAPGPVTAVSDADGAALFARAKTH